MDRFQKYRKLLSADLLPLLAVVLCTVIVSICCTPKKSVFDDKVTDLTSGWDAEDGKTYSIEELPCGDITITHSLKNVDTNRKRICFRSTDTHITAAFDGEVTYSYAPKLANILGKSYGMYVHMIPIPVGAESVTLTLHPIYNGRTPKLRNVAVEDAGMFMGDIYHSGLPDFALCMLIALYGVLMLILGFTTRSAAKYVNFFSLGAFAILVGIWSANDTLILQVFTQRPEIIRFINYLCLIFIAYLPVSFMASVTDNRKSVLLPILFALVTVNFALTMTLSALDIRDVRQMLLFSHINIAVAMCMTVYFMAVAFRKKTIDRNFLQTVIIGMTCAVLGVAVDLIRFKFIKNSIFGSSLFTRVGVLIFVVLMDIHLMRERTRLAVEQGKSELMVKIAYTDVLTELANRAAFHEKEAEIRRERLACVIVQLDINFLKKVNDVYGHAEGDRHIISAAHIIRDSFSNIGTSYRTGGDEFIVVAEKCGSSEVESALADLEKRVADYNSKETPPVPLQIAYGFANCEPKADTLDAAEKLADERMYEKKRAMKDQA
ncbi:MAG: diguanylate cyclase [Ruminococcus sp.]|nr:diguanylate cyclase [Ruminococcus sp.]